MMPYTATVLLLLAMGGTVAPVHAAEEVTEPEEFEEQEDITYNIAYFLYSNTYLDHQQHMCTLILTKLAISNCLKQKTYDGKD